MDQPEIARMRESLAEHRSAGEYVLQTARMVGDEDDHAVWRRSRCAWRDALTAALERAFPDAPRGALDVRLGGAPAGWKKLYEAEIRTVADGLELLAELDRSLHVAPEAEPRALATA
ncbi:MAG TPA: hypothetical protein VFW29_03945 [Solirubrobacteraceae bacterium]|nr:hypothetical protein [Solirubrobacteraceae bacterium]